MATENENANPEAPEPENLSIVSEFMLFLGENKKWWLVPLVSMCLLLGLLLALGAGPAAPFIYSLF